MHYFVKEEQISGFQFGASKKNLVRKYWRFIVKNMPEELKNEVRTKRTDLVDLNCNSKKLYIFHPENASWQLQNYLSKYEILAV